MAHPPGQALDIQKAPYELTFCDFQLLVCTLKLGAETVNVGRRDFLSYTADQDCLTYVNPLTHKHNSLQFNEKKILAIYSYTAHE